MVYATGITVAIRTTRIGAGPVHMRISGAGVERTTADMIAVMEGLSNIIQAVEES
jgi:hypothetical protein